MQVYQYCCHKRDTDLSQALLCQCIITAFQLEKDVTSAQRHHIHLSLSLMHHILSVIAHPLVIYN